MSRAFYIFSWILAPLSCVVLLALNAIYGNLNQDEGWYLYAAKMVSEGQSVYGDFAFTQGPVLPWVYSLGFWEGYSLIDLLGVSGGRLITMVFGFASCVLTAVLAGQLSPKGWRRYAGLLAFIFVAFNVYQSYFFSIVKTYALCSFFLQLGLIFLVQTCSKPRAHAAPVLAALFLVLATGTRLSAGLTLPVAAIFLLLAYKRLGWRNGLIFCGSAFAFLVLLFYPCYLSNAEGFVFGLFEYHQQRAIDPGWRSLLLFKAGFISRMVQAYFVPLCALLGLGLFYCYPRKTERPEKFPTGMAMIWAVCIVVTLFHILTRFPYDDYQVIIFPAFVAVLAASIIRIPERLGLEESVTIWRGWVPFFFLLISIGAAFSSPVNQSWFVINQDVIWWKIKKQSDLAQLENAAFKVLQWSEGSPDLLTQDSYLAIRTGKRVPKNMNMGVFSYFPEFSRVRAENLRVTNHEMLLENIRTSEARVAAFSDWGFAIASPEIIPVSQEKSDELWAAVEERYVEVEVIPDFGQGHTPLRIFLRRDAVQSEKALPEPPEAPEVE